MQMKLRKSSRTLAIAVAAFALTVTSVQAFGNQEFLTKAGLSDDQVVAVQEARELRKMGDLEAARDVLLEAGIDEETIQGLRQAHKEQRQHNPHWQKEQIAEQLTDDQLEAIQVAREANDREAVRAILEEAGIEQPGRSERGHQFDPAE